MVNRFGFSLCLLIASVTFCFAQEKSLSGKVTYISSTSVYVDIGRASGVKESNLLYIVRSYDTVAVLKVFAVSAKSIACTIQSAVATIQVGDLVSGVVLTSSELPKANTLTPQIELVPQTITSTSISSLKTKESSKWDVRGRISAQYFSAMYDDNNFNLSQPSLNVNLRVAPNQSPYRLELYGNLRSLGVGGKSAYSGSAQNQSRLYRLALSYEKENLLASVGRIIPIEAPMLGYIDGVCVARKYNKWLFGGSFGFQPNLLTFAPESIYKKMALFVQLQPNIRTTVSASYGRIYYKWNLDRELVNVNGNASITERLFVYGNIESDFQKKSGDRLKYAPRLSNLYATANYRLLDKLTLGLGIESVRPIYLFNTIRGISDSLIDSKLRTGFTLSASLQLPYGASLYETYSPRSNEKGFGNDYTTSTSLGFSNFFLDGLSTRFNLNKTHSDFANTIGYGLSAYKNVYKFDLGIRYQHYENQFVSQNQKSDGFGFDVLYSINRAFSLNASLDRNHSYGLTVTQYFLETSWRF